MTKPKSNGAGKKKMTAPVHSRKSKTVSLSGPKDPVKRLISKGADLPVRRRPAAKNLTAKQGKKLYSILKAPTRHEELPSILDVQMRLFESMVRFTPLGYFLAIQRLAREGASPHRLSTVSPFAFSTIPIA